jgi:hypothetical protein
VPDRITPLCFLSVVLLQAPVSGADEILPKPLPLPPAKETTPDWELREVANFAVHFQSGDVDLAEKLAECAERTRTELYRNWFAVEHPVDWSRKCEVFMHASMSSYAEATDYRASSSGYSVTHSNRGRVVSQRIDLLQDGSDLLRAVLPHELAHVLLSHFFVRRPLPLWAEEGLAVLAETREIRNAHLKNLDTYARRGTLYTAQELMGMREYPAADQRGVFYAQSVSMVEFLINRRGTPQFMEFLNLAVRQGSETVLKRVYGVSSLQELHQDWLASTISLNKLGMSR